MALTRVRRECACCLPGAVSAVAVQLRTQRADKAPVARRGPAEVFVYRQLGPVLDYCDRSRHGPKPCRDSASADTGHTVHAWMTARRINQVAQLQQVGQSVAAQMHPQHPPAAFHQYF